MIEVRKSNIEGVGVFATRSISEGEVIHRIDDSRVVDEAHPIRPDLEEDEKHCDYLPNGMVVLMQSPAGRFNHSCSPNIYHYSVNRQRFILAMRDIDEGEELHNDYSIDAIGGAVWTCRCGAANCRGTHQCDFFALSEERQLQYLPYLDPWFVEVHEDRICNLLKKNWLYPGFSTVKL